MRLTKQMKSSLLNIIQNKTKHPFKVHEDAITQELQEYIYKKEPVFKQYLDLYVDPPYSRYREKIEINGYYTYSIYVAAPSAGYLKKLIGQKPSYYCQEFPVKDKNPDYVVDPDFEPIYNKLTQFAKECEEYEDVFDKLAITINSCTTDTQLADMYPDFVQYFNSAGITKTPATKQLPATFGLPDALAKFGLELSSSPEPEETEEPNIDTLVQQDLQKHLSK
nr:MAG TPA: Nucleotide modification associated domain 5 [Caudoviricetes sp.]